MKNIHYLSILTFIAASLLTGCESTGPVYHNIKASITPQSGKGLVIIYFKFIRGNGAPKVRIYANGTFLTGALTRDLSYTYQAEPGTLHIYSSQTYGGLGVLSAIPKDAPTIQIEPNHTYYMQVTTGFFLANETLKQVSEEVGQEEIKDLQWLNPPSSH